MSHRPWINAGLKIAPENGCSFAALHMSACGTSRRFAATQSLSRRSFPFIERVFADAGYAGECVAGATSVAFEIVRKAPIKSASPFSRDAGLSSASSPGSGATGDWRRTSKPQ
jgi:hypothetical protein